MVRKGMVEVQLNWIFVLIAGAVILLVFFTFSQKQRSAAQTEIANTIIQDLETIVVSAGASKRAAQTISIPDIQIAFSCSEECSCEMSVGPVSRNFEEKIIYSPGIIEGTELGIWALPWKAPFRVGNLLYASNKRIPIFMVYSSEPDSVALKNRMEKEVPDVFEVLFVEKDRASSIPNQNYKDAVFVYLNTEITPIHETFADVPVRAVKIEEDEKEHGKATFYSKEDAGFEQAVSTTYLGSPMRYATIFSGSDTSFMCQRENVYKRYKNILSIYLKRTEQLPSALCEKGYQGAEEIFSNMIAALEEKEAEEKNLDAVIPLIDELEAYNEDLLIQGCPLLY